MDDFQWFVVLWVFWTVLLFTVCLYFGLEQHGLVTVLGYKDLIWNRFLNLGLVNLIMWEQGFNWFYLLFVQQHHFASKFYFFEIRREISLFDLF